MTATIAYQNQMVAQVNKCLATLSNASYSHSVRAAFRWLAEHARMVGVFALWISDAAREGDLSSSVRSAFI
jgi:hypothetical protein